MHSFCTATVSVICHCNHSANIEMIFCELQKNWEEFSEHLYKAGEVNDM